MVFVHLHLSPFSPPLSTFFRSRSLQVSPACPNRSPTLVSCVLQSQMENDVAKGKFYEKSVERDEIPLGLPGKGRTASDTLDLLKISNMQVWFQRPKDIIRKLISGDLDLGIVGLDTFSEYGEENEDLIIVHDDLDYGHCHLSLAIPKYGIFENINSVKELAQMPQWTEERPLRVATEFTYLGPKFVKENGLKDVSFSTADGGLEATPAMGIADAILDLVSSGKTLKKIEGGGVLEIQAVLVASRRALTERKDALETTHEILERLEAHFRAVNQFTVTANMRGTSAEEVAERVQSQPSLSGLQIGGIGVLISPLIYESDEETPRVYL